MAGDTSERIPLEELSSSYIAAAGFSPERQTLVVKFKSGAIFLYLGISLELATAFYTAESLGKFYAQQIKGKFSGQRLDGRCPKCGGRGDYVGDKCSDCGTADVVAFDYQHTEE